MAGVSPLLSKPMRPLTRVSPSRASMSFSCQWLSPYPGLMLAESSMGSSVGSFPSAGLATALRNTSFPDISKEDSESWWGVSEPGAR